MVKFRTPDSPAFNAGEKWINSSGLVVEITSTHRFGTGKWDVAIFYQDTDNNPYSKDAWHFQVRYSHTSDLK